MDFIKDYMEYTKPLKGYRPFHLWSCLSLLATTLGRKCYIQRNGGRETYANMYAVLLGPAGVGKTESIKNVETLIRAHNSEPDVKKFKKEIVMANTKITPAALIEALCEINSEPTETNLYGKGRDKAELFIPAREFAVTFGDIGGGSLMVDLLDLFDCPNVFDKRTRGQGRETCQKPSLNILGGSVTKTLRKLISLEATGTGFSARIIFVSFMGSRTDISNKAVAQPEWLDKELYMSLVAQLKEINLREGPMLETAEAVKYINQKSDDFFIEAGGMVEGSLQQDFRTRKAFHMMKVAMCLAASYGRMTVNLQDYEQAYEIISSIEPGLSGIFGATNFEHLPTGSFDFLEMIPGFPQKIEAKALRKKVFTDGQMFMDEYQFDRVLNSLISAGLIDIRKENGNAYITRK